MASQRYTHTHTHTHTHSVRARACVREHSVQNYLYKSCTPQYTNKIQFGPALDGRRHVCRLADEVAGSVELRITSLAGNSERQNLVRCTALDTVDISAATPVSGCGDVKPAAAPYAGHVRTAALGPSIRVTLWMRDGRGRRRWRPAPGLAASGGRGRAPAGIAGGDASSLGSLKKISFHENE
ncbi:hypothetical protein EVAR_92292_1 [Eumeta japonica]|uniref:Uncharacterized protein n=1 Tax=Eumeta variegata TaxID=151549 RepID=A0A4C1TNN7_EUMVA|nr:hypothetical protein EVAR_92292_1 [Eumeta japonica]